MVLIESLGVLGKGVLDYAINNAYLFYISTHSILNHINTRSHTFSLK